MTTLGTAGEAVPGALLDSATVMSPGAAPHSSVTVPVETPPPATRLGLSVTELARTGRTVKSRVTVAPPEVALIVPVTREVTAVTVYLKVFEVCPAGTVTTAGNETAGCSSVMTTTAPDAGAGPSSVTRP